MTTVLMIAALILTILSGIDYVVAQVRGSRTDRETGV